MEAGQAGRCAAGVRVLRRSGEGPWVGTTTRALLPGGVTLPMLIRSLFRLTSVSSQTSASGPTGWEARWGVGPSPSGGRPGRIGGAFSWSLRCSPCSTSSVFSLSRSPGTGVTLTTLGRPGGNHWQGWQGCPLLPAQALEITATHGSGHRQGPDRGGGDPKPITTLGSQTPSSGWQTAGRRCGCQVGTAPPSCIYLRDPTAFQALPDFLCSSLAGFL